MGRRAKRLQQRQKQKVQTVVHVSCPRPDECPRCGTLGSETERYCTTCKFDLGAPNVRECSTEEERKALAKRVQEARSRARYRKCLQEFDNLSHVVETTSEVVVTMPAAVALDMVSDPPKIYVNYEALVGAKVRRSAELEQDKHRKAVAGILFGTYGDKLIYGILSLTSRGLPSYGDVYCRLRSIAVADRTTFLECNSYKFVEQHNLRPGAKVPPGFRATWDDRHRIALAKLGQRLPYGSNKEDWQELLVQSGGRDRSKDEFIEAHVYDFFDIGAVAEMLSATGKHEVLVKLALERFSRRRTGGGKTK